MVPANVGGLVRGEAGRELRCCPTMLGRFRWRSQSQCRRIGSHMKPIDLAERLGRWSSDRGSLHTLLAARLRQLIDEGELVGAENLCNQATVVNHGPGAIAPLGPELIQIRDAVGQLP
jgi:hypothetical protein